MLTHQHAGTTRLRLRRHSVELGTIAEVSARFLAETSEAAALSARLHRPGQTLRAAGGLLQAQALGSARDSLEAAIAGLDRLGSPIPWVLANRWAFYSSLNRAQWDAYFLGKLAQYRRHGPPESLAVCYQAVGCRRRPIQA